MEAAPTPVRRGAPTWLAPTLVVATTVVLLSLLAAGASAFTSAHDSWDLLDLDGTDQVVVIAVSLVGAVAVGFLLPLFAFAAPGLFWATRRGGRRNRAVQSIITVVAFCALLSMAPRVLRPDGEGAAKLPSTETQDGHRRSSGSSGSDAPVGLWVAGAALGLGALAGIALVVSMRRKPDAFTTNDDISSPSPLDDAVETSLDAVFSEPDARRAVILAYIRMESTLSAHGIPRATWESPREYLVRVFSDVGERAVAATTLTGLYEEARFADHPVGEDMRRRAQDALLDLRAALAAPA
jgi:hypothetical protein